MPPVKDDKNVFSLTKYLVHLWLAYCVFVAFLHEFHFQLIKYFRATSAILYTGYIAQAVLVLVIIVFFYNKQKKSSR